MLTFISKAWDRGQNVQILTCSEHSRLGSPKKIPVHSGKQNHTRYFQQMVLNTEDLLHRNWKAELIQELITARTAPIASAGGHREEVVSPGPWWRHQASRTAAGEGAGGGGGMWMAGGQAAGRTRPSCCWHLCKVGKAGAGSRKGCPEADYRCRLRKPGGRSHPSVPSPSCAPHCHPVLLNRPEASRQGYLRGVVWRAQAQRGRAGAQQPG